MKQLVNLSFFLFFFKKTNTIIISENKNNILRNFAKKKIINFIKHTPSKYWRKIFSFFRCWYASSIFNGTKYKKI